MRRATTAALRASCLWAALLSAAPASAIPLRTDFGGPLGYGEHALPAGDSVWSAPIALEASFPAGVEWWGLHTRTMWINTNGIVSLASPFDASLADVPVPFPVRGRPLLAPFWSDIDTRRGGAPERDSIWWTTQPGLIAITWHDVERFSAEASPSDALTNDFQMILTADLRCPISEWWVELRYHRIEWSAATLSRNGTAPSHARVGFDDGNASSYVSLPMSGSARIADVVGLSNVPDGPPGLFRFAARQARDFGGCPDQGRPCTIAASPGRCGLGIVACEGSRSFCRAMTPRAPRCNGLDNDCDGHTDDSDALCAAGMRCDTLRGACVRACASDADCDAVDHCVDGRCAGRACEGFRCAAGEVCRGGGCANVCQEVHCPWGQRCVAGACVDPCDGVQCTDGLRCIDGVCGYGCACDACPNGAICNNAFVCVAARCVGVTCPAGTHCDDGSCVDNCASATGERLCQPDEVCEGGHCVLDLGACTPDAGAADAAPTYDASDAAPGADAAGPDASMRHSAPSPDCGCRTRPPPRCTEWRWLLAAAVVSRRRRRCAKAKVMRCHVARPPPDRWCWQPDR